jgi:hypothetical protein
VFSVLGSTVLPGLPAQAKWEPTLLACPPHLQTTSDNVTTVRYTLPKAVGEHGCRLYVEGRFSVPASLLGPDAVGGWAGG